MTTIRFVMVVVAIARGWPQSPPRPPKLPAPKPPAIQTLTPKVPFEWSKTQKKEFLNRVKTLKAGDNIYDVAKLLGPPYEVEQISGKGLNDEVRGTFTTYFMKKQEESENLASEQYISLTFGIDGRLECISTNIRKLSFGGLMTEQGIRFTDLEPLDEPSNSR